MFARAVSCASTRFSRYCSHSPLQGPAPTHVWLCCAKLVVSSHRDCRNLPTAPPAQRPTVDGPQIAELIEEARARVVDGAAAGTARTARKAMTAIVEAALERASVPAPLVRLWVLSRFHVSLERVHSVLQAAGGDVERAAEMIVSLPPAPPLGTAAAAALPPNVSVPPHQRRQLLQRDRERAALRRDALDHIAPAYGEEKKQPAAAPTRPADDGNDDNDDEWVVVPEDGEGFDLGAVRSVFSADRLNEAREAAQRQRVAQCLAALKNTAATGLISREEHSALKRQLLVAAGVSLAPHSPRRDEGRGSQGMRGRG